MALVVLFGTAANGLAISGAEARQLDRDLLKQVEASVSKRDANTAEMPKYIFYMIGDGMGQSHRQLAEYYLQYKNEDDGLVLAMNDMPITANITTHNTNTLVTDSAAAGTALATGVKTKTGKIGFNEDGSVKYRTIAEALQEDRDMAIGLITTVSVTHATPAAFGAHVMDRNDEVSVADQYLAREWDFIAGGGYRYFAEKDEDGNREAGDSLLDDFEKAGYDVDTSLGDFEKTDFSAVDKYLGIYESKYLTEVITQKYDKKVSPELSEMVEAGIEVLSKNENGFFMMVEGGYIDGASHNNDTPTTLYEMLAFEESVQVAVNFYKEHPEDTLIIVGADHETGGLSLGYNSYAINFNRLDGIHVAYEKAIDVHLQKGDEDAYFAAMEEYYGVKVSEEERKTILANIEAFDLLALLADAGVTDPAKIEMYESMRHMLGISGHCSAHLLAEQTKIGWSTQAHTGEPVPFTFMGKGSETFAACHDNIDIPIALAELAGVNIG